MLTAIALATKDKHWQIASIIMYTNNCKLYRASKSSPAAPVLAGPVLLLVKIKVYFYKM